MSQLPRIALLGRPNVGKSTLFNRLIGRKKALVDNQPGITRDRHYENITINGHEITLVDTAGYDVGSREELARQLNKVSEAALQEADAAVLVVDGLDGVTPVESSLAKLLHKSGKPCLVVVTKIDAKAAEKTPMESYSLGLGEPVAVSAEHNIGVYSLEQAMLALVASKLQEEGDKTEDDVLRVTIVGRPNAGKSTLVNQILGQERMLTGPQAGLTRESLSTRWEYNGRTFELVDTAGLRKKARIDDRVEKMSASSTIEAIDKAQIVILVLDATAPFEQQDRTIASRVVNEGKPLIVALNKWDLVEDKNATMLDVKWLLSHSLSQVRGVPTVTMSALRGKGVMDLFPVIEKLYDLWNIRLSTADINRALEGLIDSHAHPLNKSHKFVKIKYGAQLGQRPPTFGLWCNRPEDVTDAYLRYLQNGFREVFGLDGVVIRFVTKGGKNPYANR